MKRCLGICLVSILSGLFPGTARADYSEQLFRSVEAQAMGGAVVASTDDDLALFLNPAGLAGVKKLKFRFLNATIEASNDLAKDPATIMPLLSGGISSTLINSLIGKNYYLRVQDIATVSFQGFAVGVIGDAQAAIRLINPNSPTGTVGLQTTYGLQVGYGDTVYKFAKKRGEIRFGVSGKYLYRAGGFHQPSVTDILTLNMNEIIGDYRTYGTGIGIDTGTQIIYRLSNKFTVTGGLVVTDIGGTKFSNSSPSIPPNFSMGTSFRYKSNDIVATLAYDYQHVLDSMDWQKKVHLGLQLKMPILTLSGGFSELYPTYGVGLDLGVAQINYTNYSDELSSLFGINPESRHMITAKVDFVF